MKPVIKSVAWCAVLVGSSFLVNFAIAECDSTSININNPDSRYLNNTNGTVTDIDTGLMWQKCSLGLSGPDCEISTRMEIDTETEMEVEVDTVQLFSWQAALMEANNSTENGFSDWRLPNIKELTSLVENSCAEPSVNEVVFPATVANTYWTSSPVVGVSASARSAWVVSFINGGIDKQYKFQEYSVRLVRNDALVP